MAKREEWVKGKKRNFENSIADIVAATVRPVIEQHSKLQADMILNWGKIFDKSLAGKIRFKKLVMTDKANNRFLLYVAVKPIDMLEMTHSTGIMKEQLAVFLGYDGCEGIKIMRE